MSRNPEPYFKRRTFFLPALILFAAGVISFGIFLLSDYTDARMVGAGNAPQWAQETGLGASIPACGSSSNTFPTCSGSSPSLTISWTWTVNAAHTRECNLTNIGIYNQGGVQVQGYQRACNDSVTWTGGESGTVYSYNVYFVDVDGNPPIETKSGTFTTPYCTPVSITSCSASPPTANINENVTWTATPQGGLAPTTPKQEWIGNTTNGGWAAPPGGDTAILARRFQATADYNLKVVSLDIAKESSVTGTLWVTIETDSGGIPSGSVLSNGTSPTIAEGQVWSWAPTGWVQFYLNNTRLVAGTNYWIVLRGSLSGPGNKIIAMDTLAADPNPGSLSLIHSWGAPAWTNTGASYGYRIYAPTYTYTWHGDAPLEGRTGNPSVVQYPAGGSKSGNVDVSDGVSTANASCGIVTVNPAVPPTCSADPSSVSTRQNTTATGNGGSGSYTWSGGENPAISSGPTFTTNYTTEGSKTITITGGGSNTCPVTVYQPTLVIDPPSVSVQVGNTAPLTALYDADGPGGPSGNVIVTSSATWLSDSPGIATVNASGVVTGVSAGSTIIRAAYTDSFGNALAATADITVTALPVLSISLSASPPSPGIAPFSTTLTPQITSYTGNPSDTINYSLWWNCSQTTTSVGTAEAACGALPAPSLGSCAENSVGYKCNAVTSSSISVPHTYATPTGSPFSPKVIIERDSAVPKEARIAIAVSWPAIGGSCAVPPSADVGDPVTWSASGTGGDGSYTYEWYSMTGSPSPATCAGQPSLACQSFPTSYGAPGTKSGNVRIRSAGLTPYETACSSPVTISGRIISFGGDPSVIFSGGTANLKWKTSGYSNGQCSIDNGIGVANPAAEGSLPTPVLTTTTTYRITCDDGFGPELRDATVVVGTPPTFKEIPPN